MKKIIIGLVSILALASCHNYAREQADNKAKASADSARRADSLSKATNDSSEMVNFKKLIDFQIDSMQMQLAHLDSTYARDKKMDKLKWQNNRKHIQTRLEKLKAREREAGSIAKEKWADFKEEIDTAIHNIKYEWKNGE